MEIGPAVTADQHWRSAEGDQAASDGNRLQLAAGCVHDRGARASHLIGIHNIDQIKVCREPHRADFQERGVKSFRKESGETKTVAAAKI